ncbi:hypothetical protein SH449x_000170 [Pirellulaceae bacterium SH449]
MRTNQSIGLAVMLKVGVWHLIATNPPMGFGPAWIVQHAPVWGVGESATAPSGL